MKRKHLLSIVFMILTLAISTLACGSEVAESPQETSEPDTETQIVPDEDVVADETEEDISAEAETQTEPTSIYVLSAVDPDTPGFFYSPVDGSHLVTVEVVLENHEPEPMNVNPLNFSLVDDQGLVHTIELGASDAHDQVATLDLYTGERVRGWVSFTIEDGTTPVNLKYDLGFLSDETILVNIPQEFSEPEWSLHGISLEHPNIGDISEVSGMSLTSLALVDPSPAGSLYSEEVGKHLVSIEILIRNESLPEPHTVNPLNAYLVDTLGFVYAVELGSSDLGQIDTVDISAGEGVKGFVTFEIPDGREPVYVHYQTDFWGDEPPLTVGLTE